MTDRLALAITIPSAVLRFHPVDLGDLPPFVLYSACHEWLPFSDRTVTANWRTRYASFMSRRSSEDGGINAGLWVDVKAADCFLDARGRALLSEHLLKEKKRRNPGWIPARDVLIKLAALDGAPASTLSNGAHGSAT